MIYEEKTHTQNAISKRDNYLFQVNALTGKIYALLLSTESRLC